MDSQEEESPPSPGLEAVIQKLEDSLLDISAEERALTMRGEDLASTASPVPVRIREIVTRNLSASPAAGSSVSSTEMSVQEENRALRELLTQTRADRDQLAIKQSTLTDRLEQLLALQSGGESDQDSVCVERSLREEARSYRLKLQSYQESQQRQAQLVQKLQAKVLQYKTRCGELEDQVLQKTAESEKLRLSLQSHLDSSSQRLQHSEQEHQRETDRTQTLLEEERKRCSALSQVNSLLRQQLEQAAAANEALKQHLQQAQQDIQHKDARLRKEQEASASRLGREQAKVRVLWRQAASLRSSFTQLRAFTDRNLAEMRGECVSAGRQLRTACVSLELRVCERNIAPSGGEASVSSLEKQLREKLLEAMQLQARFDAERLELNSRILELTETVKHLRVQNSEKESKMAAMQASLDRMELSRAGDREERDGLLSEIQALQQIMQHIGQVARGDGDGAMSEGAKLEADGTTAPLPLPGAPSLLLTPPRGAPLPLLSPPPGVSPHRDSTLQAVQRALMQRHTQIQDLRVRLEGALEQVGVLRAEVAEGEGERRGLQEAHREAQQEVQALERALEDSRRDTHRSRSEKGALSDQVSVLEQQVCVLREEMTSQEAGLKAELDAEKGSGLDMQRQRDLLRQQRDDLEAQLRER